MDIIAQLDSHAGAVKTLLAREILTEAFTASSATITVEIVGDDAKIRFPSESGTDNILLLLSDEEDWQEEESKHFSGKIIRLKYDILFENSKQALADIQSSVLQQKTTAKKNDSPAKKVKKIIAVTSCPTGIAHTFMAAEGLNVAAKALGYDIRVETQGSVGVGTPLSSEEIRDSDLVIIAADREVDLSRFAGKPLFLSGTKAAINSGQAYIEKAIAEAKIQKNTNAEAQDNASEKDNSKDVYKHLMTGVSFMIPFVAAGSLLVAVSMFLSSATLVNGSFSHALDMIGDGSALSLFVAVLAGYIAYSIADRPALAPGMIAGYLCAQETIGAGFLGGIVAGLIAGYTILLSIKIIKLPKDLQGLLPVLILPLIGTAITTLLMIYVFGQPIAIIFKFLIAWLNQIKPIEAIILGALFGGAMAYDMGGPLNKAAYATSVALVGSHIYGPMAAVMIGGMTPPLALALACVLFPHKFIIDEQKSKVSTFLLGLVFISEGAIPFAKRDPSRVISSITIGSAVAGAVALAMGVGLKAPHGGIFLAVIPGAIHNYIGYFSALIIGTIISAILLAIVKQPVK